MPRPQYKQPAFREFLRKELKEGRVPGVLACVEFLDLNHQGARGSTIPADKKRGARRTHSGPALTTRWTAIRREEFETFGLVKVGGGYGKWVFPDTKKITRDPSKPKRGFKRGKKS